MFNFSLQRPVITISVLVGLIIFMGIGLKDLYFRGDYKIFFKPDNVNRLAYEEIQDTFSKSDSIGIVIAPRSEDVFTKETLALVKNLTDEFWQTPLSTRVDSITNFQHTFSEEDDLVVEDLLLELDWLDEDRIRFIQSVALNEPELIDKLISRSGHVTMINITVQLPDGDQTAEVAEIANFIKIKLRELEQKDDKHDFYLTGIVIMNDATQVSALNDAQSVLPLMFGLIIVLLVVLMGSWLAAVATIFVVVGSIFATMGFAGWLGIFLSMATINAPIIIMTLAVADCIHIVSSMRLNMEKGQDKDAAIANSMVLNKQPVIITSLTTAIGFLTLNFSEVPILADLGNLAALGVVFSCIMALLLFPALLKLLPIEFSRRVKQKEPNDGVWYQTVVQFSIKKARVLVVFGSILAVSATYLSTTNKLNDVAIEYWDKSSKFRQDADFQEKHLTGLSYIDFGVFTDSQSGIHEPEFLAKLDAFTEWLKLQPEVDHVSSLITVLKRLNKNMNGNDPTYYRLPDNRQSAAQYLLLYEMSLPYGLDMNHQIDVQKSATRVVATLKNLGSNEFTNLEKRAMDWFETNARDLRLVAASPPLMFAHIGESNMQAMIKAAVSALVLISVLLVFALKSVKLGIISILPNIMPAAIGFGIWSFISGEVNLALSVVVSITLGIVVDDTVHYLTKFQHARNKSLSVEQSLTFAADNVSTPLVTTSIVLAAGFAVLTLSEFTLNSDMGLLTSIVISVALFIDLVFLPAFIYLLEKNKPQPKKNF